MCSIQHSHKHKQIKKLNNIGIVDNNVNRSPIQDTNILYITHVYIILQWELFIN